ncbi:MAG: methyl-accepting chemotaxis protein [Oscillospiraceae bacterium]|jgi:methyl-accepting chemotaxis protein|nr:methyl-accepting chemotaxis protein [Oscillospiraceae bacterium]
MKIKNLGLKVSLIIGLMIVAIIGVMVYIVSVQSSKLVSMLTAKEAVASNVSFAKELRGLQNDAFTRATIIASSNDVVNAILRGNNAALKEALLALKENVDTVMICDTKGDVLMRAHNDQKGDNVMNQKIVSDTLSAGTGMSTIAKGATVGLATRGSAAIRDFSGNIIGAVICGHDLSNPKYVESIKNTSNCETTIFDGDTRLMTTLMDEKGNLVVGTKASDVVVNTVINGRNDYSLQIALFGRNYFAHYSPLITDGSVIGMLFTGVPIDDALKDQQSMMNMLLWTGVLFGITCILLVIVFNTFTVSRPLSKVVETLKKGENGDMQARSGIAHEDEIGVVAKAVDHFFNEMQKVVKNIRMNSDTLAGASEELSSISRQLSGGAEQTVLQSNTVASTTEQMAVNINTMAGGAEQASVNAGEVASAAEQMSANMNTIASAVEEMSVSIHQISKTIGDVRQVATEATDKATAATGAMNKLGSAAKEIGHVTDVIKKIADKTNLLALNATIEAASAGEAGKGFAVVAGEIKELANQSAQSADDISRRIEGIQSGTNDAVAVIDDVSNIIVKINHSVEAIVENVGQQTRASNEIASNVAQANTGAKRVASAIGEVAKGANDVSRNASEAARGAQNVSSNVVTMSQAAQESAQGANQVNQSAGELAAIAGELKETVSRFKV